MAGKKEPTKKPAIQYNTKKKVTKTIPYANNGEQQNMFVSLNGKSWNVPRGQAVTLPAAVWEIIDRALAAERKYQEDLRRN